MFRTNLVVVLLDPVSRQFRKISKHFRAVSPLRRAASSVQASCSIHDVLLRFWNVWRSITDLEKEQTKKTYWKENKSQGNSVRVVPTCEHVWPITSGVLCTREDLLSRWYLDKNRKHEKNQKNLWEGCSFISNTISSFHVSRIYWINPCRKCIRDFLKPLG